MSESGVKIQYRCLDTLPGVELVQAHYQQFSFEKHVHEDIHIGVVDLGAQQFMHKGQGYLLAPNHLSIINPDEVHDGHGVNHDDYRVQLLRIPLKTLSQFGHSLGIRQPSIYLRGPDVADEQLYRQLLRLHYKNAANNTSALALDTALIDVLSLLVGRYRDSVVPQTLQDNSPSSPKVFSELKDYFMADLSRSYRLPELAGLFDLSEHQFLRRFRQYMGITPHAYLLGLRIERARELIKNKYSLAEVATDVGFYDQSHFTHAFKRRYNITPAVYQQQANQGAKFYNHSR